MLRDFLKALVSGGTAASDDPKHQTESDTCCIWEEEVSQIPDQVPYPRCVLNVAQSHLFWKRWCLSVAESPVPRKLQPGFQSDVGLFLVPLSRGDVRRIVRKSECCLITEASKEAPTTWKDRVL